MGGVRLIPVAVIGAVLCIAQGRPQSDDQTFLANPYSQSDRRNGYEGVQQSSSSQPVRPFSQADAREDPRDGSKSLPVRPFNQPNQREVPPERLPIRPFSQYDPKRVVAPHLSQPVSPFRNPESAPEREAHVGKQSARDQQEDPYQSRAHSTPLNPHISLQSDQDRHRHHSTTGHASGSPSPSSSQDNRRKNETPNWSTSHVHLDPTRRQSGSGHSVGQQQSPPPAPVHRDNRWTGPQEQRGKAPQRGQQGGGSTVRMGGVDVPANESERGNSESGVVEGIIFPGPTRDGNGGKVTPGKFVPAVGEVEPNCAKGSTFCESIDNYPSEYLKTILKKQADGLKEFFGNDLLLNDTTLVQRFDSTDENPLCQSVEQVVYPKMAQNKEDKWLYVVNQDQYIQGVRVEKCLKPESECLLTTSFPLGYKTICRQKYIYRRMLALNDDGKTLSDTFRLPSCCSCFVKTEA